MRALAPYLPAVLFDWERQSPGRRAWAEDGALAFFDVSGFTAMSERMAKLGREGAEVVTDVIGSTFDALLAVAYEAGGSLLKFGGDALLLYFNGDDAARRACQAAGRMRAAMRRLGPVPTPLGAVRLRMSAGVHAGTFHFFLVGSSTKELLVCSPGASRCVEMEAAAQAGEILVSPETVELVGRRWVGAASGPGFLLASPPPGGDRIVPTLPDVSGIDLATYIDPMVREAVSGGGEEAEHRHAAVGFVHFDGTDDLIRHHGIDTTADRLDELVGVVQKACDEYGVALLNSDVDADGGKFLLCAGAPLASADEDERMLRTLRAVVEARPSIPVRAGAHRGLLFAGSIGPSYRRSYTLMGDVVNTAARVMSNAKPGEVLALKPVLDGAVSRFSARRLPPFAAKGKSRPLVAYKVGPPSGGTVERGYSGRFLGREAESARIDALVAAARRGTGGLLEVRGELGIGKTRLLSEACDRADGAQRLSIRAEAYRSATPYFPFHGVVQRLLAECESDPALAPHVPLLRVAAGLDAVDARLSDVDQRVFRTRLHAAVTALFDHATDGLVLLFVDEVQWLDDGSAALVRHLGWEAQSRPWAVLAARWNTDGPRLVGGGIGEVMDLGPLPTVDAEALVAERTAEPLLPQHVERVVSRAAGNPLFLEQLLLAFDPDDDAGLPAGLEALVSSRIDRLPPNDRGWLRALSVLGTRFDRDTAAVVLDQPLLELDVVRRALGDFLEIDQGGGGGAFRQGVFQSVAYAGLSYRRRREMHERVALHIEHRGADGDAALLATHFNLAQRWDRAWKYGLAAASHASDRYAYTEAVGLYEGALRAAARLSGSGSVGVGVGGNVDQDDLRAAWQGYGDALRQMGRLADAVAPYAKARRLAADDDVAVQARLCLVEGDLRQRLGRMPTAIRWFRRGLALLDGRVDLDADARKTKVRLLAALGKVRHDQGRHADARRDLQQALAEAEAAGDTAGLAHASLWLAYEYEATAHEGHEELAQRALALYRQMDAKPWEAAAYNALGVSAKRRGEWDEARSLYAQAGAMLRAGGDPVSAAIVDYNASEVLLLQGRGAEAAELLEWVQRTFQAAGHAYEPIAAAALADARALAARSGDDAAVADAMFGEAVRRMREAGLSSFVRDAEVRWAEGRLRAGDIDGAAALVEASPAGSDPEVEAAALRVRATVAWRRGDVASARAAAKEALRVATRAGSPHGAALAELLLADLDAGGRRDAEVALARLGVVISSRTFWREACTDQSS